MSQTTKFLLATIRGTAATCPSLQIEDTAMNSVLTELRIYVGLAVYVVISCEKDPKRRGQISKGKEEKH